jgi:hypothetical protein
MAQALAPTTAGRRSARVSLWLRLVSKIAVLPNGCWHWAGATGARQRGGRTGRLRLGGRENSWVQPHRVMLILATGKPPTPAHHACHQCPMDDELCCNPLHLYWGVQSENEADKHDTIEAADEEARV